MTASGIVGGFDTRRNVWFVRWSGLQDALLPLAAVLKCGHRGIHRETKIQFEYELKRGRALIDSFTLLSQSGRRPRGLAIRAAEHARVFVEAAGRGETEL